MVFSRLGVVIAGASCALATAAAAQPAPAAAPPAPAAAAPAAPANTPEQDAAIAALKLYNPAAAQPKLYAGKAYLTLSTSGGRTQNVFAVASVNGPAGAKIRVFLSYAAKLTPPFDPVLELRLLKQNTSELPYGYWAFVEAPDGTETIAYEVELGVDAPASAVQEVMTTLANRADALEKELTGKDDF